MRENRLLHFFCTSNIVLTNLEMWPLKVAAMRSAGHFPPCRSEEPTSITCTPYSLSVAGTDEMVAVL